MSDSSKGDAMAGILSMPFVAIAGGFVLGFAIYFGSPLWITIGAIALAVGIVGTAAMPFLMMGMVSGLPKDEVQNKTQNNETFENTHTNVNKLVNNVKNNPVANQHAEKHQIVESVFNKQFVKVSSASTIKNSINFSEHKPLISLGGIFHGSFFNWVGSFFYSQPKAQSTTPVAQQEQQQTKRM